MAEAVNVVTENDGFDSICDFNEESRVTEVPNYDNFSVENKQVLLTYSNVFSNTAGKLDKSFEFVIDVTGIKPVYCTPRQVALHYRNDVKQQVAEMCDKGIIVPSHSAWCFPIVVAKKNREKFDYVLILGH